MGLKRFVKKITKPIAKVLDKVVPNEIKPFLPYAAAAFPFLAPGAFGTAASGIGSLVKAGRFAPQIGGALFQGGLNLTSQLAQEGSEGDFSGLSLGLAGLQGAMSVPGATNVAGDVVRQSSADVFGRAAEGATGLKKLGLGALEKGAKGIAESQSVFQNLGDASIGEIAKASFPAATQGSIDSGIATARRALQQYEDDLAAYELETGEAQTASDAARRAAIRAAMTAGGHSEDVISETFALLGLKDGGRVGLREGGVLAQILPQPSIAGFQPFAQPLMATAQMPVFPRLNQLEQEVNRAEGTLNRIRNRLGEEQRTLAGLASFQPGIGLQQPININSLLRSPISALQQVDNREVNQMESYKDGGVTKLKKGGMMDLGGKEMDLRGGGFVPIGKKERADDVPARLSKYEFVMTADAVRGAGGGNINEGARRMYETMNRLEARA